ncbi:hypothetical protein DH09_01790 [Bacillaceae bacterium JMAK1]|nr:hypothetical protein DH09_01790 [Bacillaceae bacterium JMAK1]
MRRRSEGGESDQGRGWLVTFSDMVLIILVFFIMLFSISNVDAQRFQALSESFSGTSIMDELSSITEFEDEQIEQLTDEEEDVDHFTEVKEYIDEYLIEHDLGDMIQTIQDDRGITLILQEQLLFNSGEALILSEAKPFLDQIVSIIKGVPDYYIEVEGHTDNRPIETYRYPSNWELSGARASSVIRYITERSEKVEPGRFRATGYADTRPLVPNDSRENMQKNRRVVVMITDRTTADENQ